MMEQAGKMPNTTLEMSEQPQSGIHNEHASTAHHPFLISHAKTGDLNPFKSQKTNRIIYRHDHCSCSSRSRFFCWRRIVASFCQNGSPAMPIVHAIPNIASIDICTVK